MTNEPHEQEVRPQPLILVVEDDPAQQMIFQDFLRLEGYQVIMAQNGREAFDLLNGGLRPNLIIADYQMPVMDGARFTQAVRSETDTTAPIILQSNQERDRIPMSPAEEASLNVLVRRKTDFEKTIEEINQLLKPPPQP